MTRLNRRTALLALAAMSGLAFRPALAFAAPTALRVVKDPNCGCCDAWVEVLQSEGFTAEVELMEYNALQAHKAASGIPAGMVSCHTAHVDGYALEGHVPATEIRRLLSERPDAVGLAVPGMPYGSPGMGPDTEREAYEVHLIRKDGTTEIFARYDAA